MLALRSSYALLKDAIEGFLADRAPTMGAALAYYTAFSIAPLLVIAIWLVGICFGEQASSGVFDTIRDLIGPNGADIIRSMVKAAGGQRHAGFVSAALGFGTMIVGASGVFVQLQDSLNLIWKAEPAPGSGLWSLVRQRLLSFSMVAAIAFLLLVSLVISASVSAAAHLLHGTMPGGPATWKAADFLLSLSVISLLFSAIFKYLPDVQLSWRDTLSGGVFTALLFAVGKQLIGLYLGNGGVSSAYGAAGSLIVVLLWVFYSAQIFLFGAELTRALVTRSGTCPPPKPGARLLERP